MTTQIGGNNVQKKLMKSLNTQRKQGAYSILIVVLVLTVLTLFLGYTDIVRKTYALNEVQGRVDRAGLNALNSSIDKDLLRDEIFGIDSENYSSKEINRQVVSDYQDKIVKKFKFEITETLGGNDLIKDVTVEKASVGFDATNWGANDRDSIHPQFTLMAVISMKVKNSVKFDVMNSNTQEFYDSKSGSNFTVSVRGNSSDGYAELAIQSSTRVVYR